MWRCFGVAEADTFLTFECDIDGCVVEVCDLSRLDMPLHYLKFFSRGSMDLVPIKSCLRKHRDLTQYTDAE